MTRRPGDAYPDFQSVSHQPTGFSRWSLRSTCRSTLLLVRPFAVLFQPCGLPRLLRPLLTSRSILQRRAFTHVTTRANLESSTHPI